MTTVSSVSYIVCILTAMTKYTAEATSGKECVVARGLRQSITSGKARQNSQQQELTAGIPHIPMDQEAGRSGGNDIRDILRAQSPVNPFLQLRPSS